VKRLLLGIVVVLIVAVAAAELVLRDSGYVLIAWGDWAMESTVWVALAGVVVTFMAVRLVLALLMGIWRSPASMGDWWRGAFSRRHRQYTRQGLRAYLEADWKTASKWLKKGAAGGGDPVVNYLFAARAHLRLNDTEAAEQLIDQAERYAGDEPVSVGLMRAEILLESGQLERALAKLLSLRQRAGDHPSILRSLVRTYRALHDWKNLEGMLAQLKKQKLLTPNDLAELEFDVYAGLLGLRQKGGVTDEYIVRLESVWKNLPDRVQRNPDVVAVYARALLHAGAGPEAEKALRHALRREFSASLVALYGCATGKDTEKQLVLAESWLKERPNHAGLLLALGRISLMNHLWGKARDYFQASLSVESNPEAYAELARLLSHLGEHEASTRYYERGLLASTRGLPNLPHPRVHAQ
jgi:HemY protein